MSQDTATKTKGGADCHAPYGFKEWALVCDALGKGTQSLILRKGGIAEGRAGFRFEHPEFYLFPTLFHEQVGRLKLPPDTALPGAVSGEIRIRLRATLEWVRIVTDLDRALALDPFHLWREEIVRERFGYGGEESLHAAYVRVHRLDPDWVFPDAPKYGGCRSWVALPEPPDTTFSGSVPVLSESENAARSEAILAVLEG